MKTAKIEELIKALLDECEKEEVTISAFIFDSEGRATCAQNGSAIDLSFAVLEQMKSIRESVDTCDCENCQKRKAQPAHEFHVDNVEDLVDVLDRIANGEFD